MFCPQCGQQQPSEDVRFCKRCGLALGPVAGLMTDDGNPFDAAGSSARALTPRQRGTRKGLLIAVAGLLFGGLAALLTAMKDDLFVFLPVAAVVFTVGIIRLLYGVLLEDDAPAARKKVSAVDDAAIREELRGAQAPELPPARSVPVSAYTPARPDTNKIPAPPSVTENTTRLLEEE